MTIKTYEGTEIFRYERLRDVVHEYIDEEDVDAFFEDMESIIKESKEIHEKQLMHLDSMLCGIYHETENSSNS